MIDFFKIIQNDNYNIILILEKELNVYNILEFNKKFDADLKKLKNNNIILDLKNVTYADSSFLAKIIDIHKKMYNNGKTLVLININKDFYSIIELAMLNKILNIENNIESAENFIDSIEAGSLNQVK